MATAGHDPSPCIVFSSNPYFSIPSSLLEPAGKGEHEARASQLLANVLLSHTYIDSRVLHPLAGGRVLSLELAP